MRSLTLVVLGVLLYVSLSSAQQTYTTKYDNINLDEILKNDRVYKRYFNCVVGQGKCTPDAKQLKDLIPDALRTTCQKCTERQRKGIEKVLRYLAEKRPGDLKTLQRLYDPQGAYTKKLIKEAENRGIKVPKV